LKGKPSVGVGLCVGYSSNTGVGSSGNNEVEGGKSSPEASPTIDPLVEDETRAEMVCGTSFALDFVPPAIRRDAKLTPRLFMKSRRGMDIYHLLKLSTFPLVPHLNPLYGPELGKTVVPGSYLAYFFTI
jgi:hypothetical protein